MARGDKTAEQAEHSGLNFSNTLQGQAGTAFNAVAPALMAEATHPMGMAPTDLAAANTVAQQSAGGSQAAATGQGALLASRTRNAGTADAAIQGAAREGGKQLSDAALKTQLTNAELKNEQQQGGLKGLEGLYGTGVGGANEALGEVARNSEADTNAKKTGFFNSFTNALGAGLGKGLGSAPFGGG